MGKDKQKYYKLLAKSIKDYRSCSVDIYFADLLYVPHFEELKNKYLSKHPDETQGREPHPDLIKNAYDWLWDKFSNEVSTNLSDSHIRRDIYSHTITQFFKNLHQQKSLYKSTHDKIYSYSLAFSTPDDSNYNTNDFYTNIAYNSSQTELGQWNQAAEAAYLIICMGEDIVQNSQECNNSFIKWQQERELNDKKAIEQNSKVDTERQKMNQKPISDIDTGTSSLDELQPMLFIPNLTQTRLYKILSQYTPRDQQAALSDLLESGVGKAGERVWVKLRADSLSYVFKQAREMGNSPIQENVKVVAHWLAAWLSWGEKAPRDVKETYANRVLRGNQKVEKSHQIRLLRQ